MKSSRNLIYTFCLGWVTCKLLLHSSLQKNIAWNIWEYGFSLKCIFFFVLGRKLPSCLDTGKSESEKTSILAFFLRIERWWFHSYVSSCRIAFNVTLLRILRYLVDHELFVLFLWKKIYMAVAKHELFPVDFKWRNKHSSLKPTPRLYSWV